MIGTLILLAKEPVAGHVKTRLTPAYTPAEAAALAGAALADTIDAVDTVAAWRHLLAFEGDPSRWLPPGWDLTVQPDGDLSARLGAAFAAAGAGSAALVAMDTPQLRAAQVEAFDPVRYDACLGRTADGGYWIIGFRDAGLGRHAFTDIPMSTAITADQQLHRLALLGLRTQLLHPLIDVDTPADADAVARSAPHTRFAVTLRSLRVGSVAG
jgi:hypothetical protein